MTRSQKFDHITPILKQLCWMPVKDHLFYCDALLTFKCMNGMATTNLSSRFIKRGTISGRSTRNENKLDIPRYKTAMGQRSFLYRAVTIWNNLPRDIKLSSLMSIFKRKLKNHILMSWFSFLISFFLFKVVSFCLVIFNTVTSLTHYKFYFIF